MMSQDTAATVCRALTCDLQHQPKNTCGCLPRGRYQMVAGMDRYLFGHSNFLWSYLIASSVVRVMSHAVSQQSRLFFMGLPTQPPPEESPSAADAADAFRRWRPPLSTRMSMTCSFSATNVDAHHTTS